MVVDPIDAPEVYLRASEEAGLRIRYVVDTHVHADHFSSGRALAESAGAAYVLHDSAGARFAFDGVRDGDRLALGNVVAEVWHVPGHTPEHIALMVADRTRAEEPWLAVTGHTLMVGDMGRTELATNAEVGARSLFASAQRLRGLADHVVVLPGAFAGSICGRGLSGTPMSTVGFERRHNRAFRLTDEEAFVSLMLTDIPRRPPHAAEVRDANLGVPEAAREAALAAASSGRA